MKKPRKLSVGDTVAIISPSWGGPNTFPHIYENGVKILREWGLNIKEYPTARMDAVFLKENPKIRAQDVNNAFKDTQVSAIFITIGGDDSVRVLPFLDKKIISENPKIIMGYSDTTTLLTFCNLLGMITFHGPSIMAGFSQMCTLPSKFKEDVHNFLFEARSKHQYTPYMTYCDGYPDWSDVEQIGQTLELKNNPGFHFINGGGSVDGLLWGGCIEVLEFLKGTDFWPPSTFWHDKILFFETSEEKPSIDRVKRMLRNYGTQGVLKQIRGVVFGRARDYSFDEKNELEIAIKAIIVDEFDCSNMMILTNMDFGHTDPQFILPLGARARINSETKTFELVESWLE
jgi:muramoyltetrapeptide carboxypeptidase LdcA involved in peptidoglycan recycling